MDLSGRNPDSLLQELANHAGLDIEPIGKIYNGDSSSDKATHDETFTTPRNSTFYKRSIAEEHGATETVWQPTKPMSNEKNEEDSTLDHSQDTPRASENGNQRSNEEFLKQMNERNEREEDERQRRIEEELRERSRLEEEERQQRGKLVDNILSRLSQPSQ